MIVCFGDSITYGQGLQDPTKDAFPALLAEMLKCPVSNRGYCGDTTRIALERFPRDVQESGARVVAIQFGHNDCNAWGSDRGHPRVALGAFAENLKEMRDRAELFGMACIFLTPHSTGLDAEYENRRKRYAMAMPGVGTTVVLPKVDLLDHIHPNERGHIAIAALAARYIKERL